MGVLICPASPQVEQELDASDLMIDTTAQAGVAWRTVATYKSPIGKSALISSRIMILVYCHVCINASFHDIPMLQGTFACH